MSEQANEFDYSNVSDADIRRSIALLTVLQDRVKTALNAVKGEAVHREIGFTMPEDAEFNGQSAGQISFVKASQGSLYVEDPIAFASQLAQSEQYMGMVEEVYYPKSFAFEKGFLEKLRGEDLFDTRTGLIIKESGVLPDGVEQRTGKAESVTFRKNKTVTDHLLEILSTEQVMKQITGKDE